MPAAGPAGTCVVRKPFSMRMQSSARAFAVAVDPLEPGEIQVATRASSARAGRSACRDRFEPARIGRTSRIERAGTVAERLGATERRGSSDKALISRICCR